VIEDYLTDTIDIITRLYDKWGALISTNTQSNVKARIEDQNKMVRNQEGKEVAGKGPIFIIDSAAVEYESVIKLKTINGVATIEPDKEYPLKSIEQSHGFEGSHWEVYI